MVSRAAWIRGRGSTWRNVSTSERKDAGVCKARRLLTCRVVQHAHHGPRGISRSVGSAHKLRNCNKRNMYNLYSMVNTTIGFVLEVQNVKLGAPMLVRDRRLPGMSVQRLLLIKFGHEMGQMHTFKTVSAPQLVVSLMPSCCSLCRSFHDSTPPTGCTS